MKNGPLVCGAIVTIAIAIVVYFWYNRDVKDENFGIMKYFPCYPKSERGSVYNNGVLEFLPCLRGYHSEYNQRLNREECCVNNYNY